MDLTTLLSLPSGTLTPVWKRIQRELIMCSEENAVSDCCEIISLEEFSKDSKDLCCVSLRRKSILTAPLLEKQRRSFYYYLCWVKQQRKSAEAFSDVLPLIFSFYFSPIPCFYIDLVVYYPKKYPFQLPEIRIKSPMNDMTKKITTPLGMWKATSVFSNNSTSMNLRGYLVHLESDILRKEIEILCPVFSDFESEQSLFTLALTVARFPEYVVERFQRYCYLKVSKWKHNTRGIFLDFPREDVFLLKDHNWNELPSLIENGINSDCSEIPLVSFQTQQATEFEQALERLKLDLTQVIYLDNC
jgi:hypothetical protein